MRKLTLCLFTALCIGVSAQTQESSFKLYGFARTDAFADSRKIYASSMDLFSFYPMYRNLNAAGEDLNATPSASMVSVGTRIGFEFNGPTDFLGAKKAISKIETDFAGSPTFMLFRIRQAYSQLIWDKSSLLVGQTWHPLSTIGLHPQVLSFNAGALFEPFNRSPMVRYEQQMNKLKLTAAAVYQMMYTSVGPDETTPTKMVSSYSYQRNALMPEMYLSLEYKNTNYLLGFGLDFKSIMPTRYIFGNELVPVKHVNTKVLSTPAAMFYGSYTNGLFNTRFKAILGQNLAEHSILGGYAITPNNKYLPFDTWTSYVHFNYGKTYEVGLMLGFSENLGAHTALPAGSNFYGFGVDKPNAVDEMMVRDVYRITPSFSYNHKNWKLGAEIEYTNAAWGKRSATGSIGFKERVSNTRVYGILVYTF